MMPRIVKFWTSIGLAAVLVGGSVALIPSLQWVNHAEHSAVALIQNTREYQDPYLLKKAWALPVARLYQPHIEFQRNASFCGPASIVNVVRSLQSAVDQATILDGTGVWTLLGYLPGGVTLDQLAEIARQKMPRAVTVVRDVDLAGFRKQLHLANDISRRYVINFDRTPLFGAGAGHHSPIAGYLVDEDLVLILDVNEKYGPWLVSSQRLYEAMNTIDNGAKRMRGLLIIK